MNASFLKRFLLVTCFETPLQGTVRRLATRLRQKEIQLNVNIIISEIRISLLTLEPRYGLGLNPGIDTPGFALGPSRLMECLGTIRDVTLEMLGENKELGDLVTRIIFVLISVKHLIRVDHLLTFYNRSANDTFIAKMCN